MNRSSNEVRAAASHSGRALQTAIAAALALAVAVVSAARLATATSAAPSAASGDAAFRARADEFIQSELKLFPEHATALGDHRYDDRVDDLSQTGVALVIGHATTWIAAFSAIDPKALSVAAEADREWLLAQLDGELLGTQQLREYEREPGMYLPTAAIYALITRNFAPAAARMRSVAAREAAALASFADARRNLKPERTPRVAIDIVLQQMPATLAFFKSDLPAAFADVPDGPEKQAFAAANARLIAAIDDYERWLRSGLAPRARGQYAIGADAYRRMLADADMVDLPLAQLEQVGNDELARLTNAFGKTAAEIDSHHSPAEVASALSHVHPAADRVMPTVAAGLAELRAFVVSHHLASIPSEVAPIVHETPPYMRATTFASMDSPGPFEKTTEAYFNVTLPDPSWPDARKEQLLEFYSPPAISDTSVHEVYPGHYVQFLNARLNRDLVRSIYHSGANSEGWALYCEQMMLDEGLHAGDARYRLAQVQMALLRACRYLVGLRMHTAGMSVDEATKFFEQHAYLTHQNATMEALRGTGDPGYLRYQLGKLMILKLREDVRRKQGAAFDLGRFHDAFLAEGAMPLRLIRRAMLGEDGPLL